MILTIMHTLTLLTILGTNFFLAVEPINLLNLLFVRIEPGSHLGKIYSHLPLVIYH